MTEHLVVTSAFYDYIFGQIISDSDEVVRALETHPDFVLRVVEDDPTVSRSGPLPEAETSDATQRIMLKD